jgi:signal transduction histidine kinase
LGIASTPTANDLGDPVSKLKLTTKVTALAGVVLAIAMTLASFIFIRALHSAQMEELNGSARLRLEETAELVRSGKAAQKLLSPRGSPLMVQVVTANADVVAASQNVGDMHTMADFSGFGWWTGNAESLQRVITNVEGSPCLMVAERVSTPTGDRLVIVAAPLQIARNAEASLKRQLGRFVPLLLAGTMALIWFVVRSAIRPVDRLRAEVDAVSPSNLSARVTAPPVDDELGRLARTMNSLLERLQGSSERQTRFVSDASHELRSPLATNRTRLEVALRSSSDVDWPVVAKNVLSENSRMERMVRDLLYLAKSDAGAAVAPFALTDLDDVVMQEIESTRTFSRVPIQSSQVSAARILGNADQLRRLVANLLENAQRHAERAVSVRLGEVDGHAELRVADDGPGIAETDRERVFDRFTRLDHARARTDGGSGLGLSIVNEIAEAHRGTVAIESTPGDGATFIVRIPLAL